MTTPAFDPADLWEHLVASGHAPDDATSTVKEHQRRLAFASHPDNQDQPGQIVSAMMGFGQGASLGFSDELAGFVNPDMLRQLARGNYGAAKRAVADAITQNRDYLTKAREAHATTTNLAQLAGGMGAATLGGAAAAPVLGGVSAGIQGAALGGVTGAATGAGMADEDRGTGALLGGATGALTGGALGKFLAPAATRIANNVVKLLARRTNSTSLPGLQNIAESISRAGATPTAGGLDTPLGVSPADIEELHHVLNGEPTMAGYRTITDMIDRAAPTEASATPATAPSSEDATQVQELLREHTISDLTDRIVQGNRGSPLGEPEAARKVAEKYIDQAAKQAAHHVSAPRVELPEVAAPAASEAPAQGAASAGGEGSPFALTPQEQATRAPTGNAAQDAARTAYNLAKAAGKSDADALEAAKRAAGFTKGSSSL